LNQVGRRFGLSDQSGTGVSCDENGVSVGAVPLLERTRGTVRGHDQWQPRPLAHINHGLSKRYGLPVEFARKVDGLKAVAQALSRGDLVHAQIATLHLKIPDPPSLAKSAQGRGEMINLARQLQASGLLKEDWDPTKHPRWPAGSPGGIGGEFAPVGSATGGSNAGEPSAPVIPAQITIPVPFELPGGIPFPSEIVPPPALPDIYPRGQLRNPFPDRPECEEEWEHAIEYCTELMRSGKMGKDGSRGFGRKFSQCVLGMVREDCGGSLTNVEGSADA